MPRNGRNDRATHLMLPLGICSIVEFKLYRLGVGESSVAPIRRKCFPSQSRLGRRVNHGSARCWIALTQWPFRMVTFTLD